METTDTFRHSTEDSTPSLSEKNMADSQLRELLAGLISSSTDLSIRVWLDGVYTNIENSSAVGNWMKGREVYFKVEGKVDSPKELGASSGRGSQ